MKSIIGFIGSKIEAKRFVIGLLLMSGLAVGTALADAKDDLARRKSDWASVKSQMNDVSGRVRDYLEKSRRLREMDKTDLDALITQICGVSIAEDNDEGAQLAKRMTDKMVDTVNREYGPISSDAESLEREVDHVLNDAKSLRESTKDLTSNDETKDEANQLLSEMSDAIDSFTNDTYSAMNKDYKTLDNVKNGVMNGANNPKIRAAMEYGKEKHIYNQRICEEKEVVLSSGRPDCVSFQKDSCAVWEFKPDSTFTDSSAAEWAKKYVEDVQEKFKDDPRALENCKKDSDGHPIFEAKGAVYPACRP